MAWYDSITRIGFWQGTGSGSLRVVSGAGARLRFNWTGTALTVDFTPVGTYTPEVSWQIDGGTVERGTVAADKVLATGLADTSHTCEIWVEGLSGNRWASLGGVIVNGITGGTLSVWPTGLPRILFCGDSILEGVAMLADGDHPPQNNGRLTYIQQACASLGLEAWGQAFGASGMTHGSTTNDAPEAIGQLGYSWSGQAWDAPSDFQLIWLGWGNNDNSADETTFKTKYRAYKAALDAAYPGAVLVMSTNSPPYVGVTQQWQIDLAAEFGCEMFRFDQVAGLSYYSGGHPSLGATTAALAPAAEAFLAPLVADFVAPSTWPPLPFLPCGCYAMSESGAGPRVGTSPYRLDLVATDDPAASPLRYVHPTNGVKAVRSYP